MAVSVDFQDVKWQKISMFHVTVLAVLFTTKIALSLEYGYIKDQL